VLRARAPRQRRPGTVAAPTAKSPAAPSCVSWHGPGDGRGHGSKRVCPILTDPHLFLSPSRHGAYDLDRRLSVMWFTSWPPVASRGGSRGTVPMGATMPMLVRNLQERLLELRQLRDEALARRDAVQADELQAEIEDLTAYLEEIAPSA
jgi:hypothetical protein